MRKILLATTALVGIVISGGAQAASSPITVNVGGSVDFLAASFAESNRGQTVGINSANHDFESLYDLNFSVLGKTGNGIQYGGNASLSNGPDISNAFNGNSDNPYFNTGYVWMSGAFGKVQLGDSHGATDLAVTAPVVGEGQVMGHYIDFLDTMVFAKNMPLGIDSTDHSTNITYYTPKVGNDNNKVQLGVSYIPQFYNYGGSAVDYNTGHNSAGAFGNTYSPYHDVVKGALAYTGNIAPVALSASAHIITGSTNYIAPAPSLTNATWVWNAPAGTAQNFTAWGLGAQGALDGFTLGGSYLDEGHYNTVIGQNKAQDQFTAGLKYEFNKVGVGVSYLGGKGYANTLSTTGATTSNAAANYIKDFTSYGAGGSYSWAPGLTSNLDGVYFDQKSDVGIENEGYVLLVSQKLAF
jgi:hypothetical protein